MQIISDRQLVVEGIDRPAGEPFDVDNQIANQLIANGTARKAQPPQVRYDTKVIVPKASEVKPGRPFRDGHLPDKES